jgi:hypothetical protein
MSEEKEKSNKKKGTYFMDNYPAFNGHKWLYNLVAFARTKQSC